MSSSKRSNTNEDQAGPSQELKVPRKRLCNYNTEWEKTYTWLVSGGDNEHAICHLCLTTFLIKWDGLKAVKSHENSEKHKGRVRGDSHGNVLKNIFVKSNTAKEDDVVLAEIANVFHYTKHHHSYQSMDCSLKLAQKCFQDSKMSCESTDCEVIMCNVLAPHSVETIREKLGDSFFAIASDASNSKNLQVLPLCVQFYTDAGIHTKVLDFYKDGGETPEVVADRIRGILKKHNLDINKVTAYMADNASVNYGKHKSVIQNLKRDNPNLIPASCNCRIIHNIPKQAGKCLGDMDVETLIIKVYNEFSISAKNVALLKDFYEFVDLDWPNILRHVPTKWLSIYPAVTRLVEKWGAIKSYFLRLGEEECDPIIWKFVYGRSDGESAESDVPTPEEAYLYFYHNVLGMFHIIILHLEQGHCSSPQVYEIMESLLNELKQRLHDGFYGFKVNMCLGHLSAQRKQELQNRLNSFYQRAIDYLQQSYDFSDGNPFSAMRVFSLTADITWAELEEAVIKLQLCHLVDMDALYTDFCAVRKVLPQVLSDCNHDFCDAKWNLLFQKCGVRSVPNMYKVVQYVLSIPVSNAFTERVFSMMGDVWSENRTKLDVAAAKAEIQCKVNFSSLNCSEFYDYLLTKPLLIKAAKSCQKYTFK